MVLFCKNWVPTVQGCFVSSNCPNGYGEEIKMYSMFSFDQLPLEKGQAFQSYTLDSLFVPNWFNSPKGSWREIQNRGLLIWLFRYYLPKEKGVPLIWKCFNSLYLIMLWAKFTKVFQSCNGGIEISINVIHILMVWCVYDNI